MINLYALEELARQKRERYEEEARRERWLRQVAPDRASLWRWAFNRAGQVLVVLGLWLELRSGALVPPSAIADHAHIPDYLDAVLSAEPNRLRRLRPWL